MGGAHKKSAVEDGDGGGSMQEIKGVVVAREWSSVDGSSESSFQRICD